MLKNIDLKLLNLSAWITLILAYILPFKVIDDFQVQAGFPIAFIAIYDVAVGSSPFNSMSVNPGGIIVNTLIIYAIIHYIKKVRSKKI